MVEVLETEEEYVITPWQDSDLNVLEISTKPNSAITMFVLNLSNLLLLLELVLSYEYYADLCNVDHLGNVDGVQFILRCG